MYVSWRDLLVFSNDLSWLVFGEYWYTCYAFCQKKLCTSYSPYVSGHCTHMHTSITIPFDDFEWTSAVQPQSHSSYAYIKWMNDQLAFVLVREILGDHFAALLKFTIFAFQLIFNQLVRFQRSSDRKEIYNEWFINPECMQFIIYY